MAIDAGDVGAGRLRMNDQQREALERLRRAAEHYPSVTNGAVHPIHCFPHDGWTPETSGSFQDAVYRGLAMAIELERLGLVEILPNTSSGIMVRVLEDSGS